MQLAAQVLYYKCMQDTQVASHTGVHELGREGLFKVDFILDGEMEGM